MNLCKEQTPKESSLKRRLFEKESSDYEVDDNSNYNILAYGEHISYVENLITPPPKGSRKIHNALTDQKQSGIKYIQNECLEKIQHLDPHNPYYGMHPHQVAYNPQIYYKNYKCKQPTYPYLIPFCNKCNLPPLLPIHPDFEMEMVAPPPIAPSPVPEREMVTSVRIPSSTPRPKMKHKQKKKPSVDENGKKIIRRRKRKSYEQLQQLIKEFQANPDWSKENMIEVSRKTGLSEAQVYKWGWDQKRKMLDPNHDIHEELKMYKREQDEEQSDSNSGIYKMKLPSSLKKPSKVTSEFQVPEDKVDRNVTKTRRTNHSSSKSDRKDNKENEHSNKLKGKPETRGVKRKMKLFRMENRDPD